MHDQQEESNNTKTQLILSLNYVLYCVHYIASLGSSSLNACFVGSHEEKVIDLREIQFYNLNQLVKGGDVYK